LMISFIIKNVFCIYLHSKPLAKHVKPLAKHIKPLAKHVKPLAKHVKPNFTTL